MTYVNAFQVIDVFEVPGRNEMLATVDVVKGSVWDVKGPLKCLEQDGEWYLSSFPMVEPLDANAELKRNRHAIGVVGVSKLQSGMTLVSD